MFQQVIFNFLRAVLHQIEEGFPGGLRVSLPVDEQLYLLLTVGENHAVALDTFDFEKAWLDWNRICFYVLLQGRFLRIFSLAALYLFGNQLASLSNVLCHFEDWRGGASTLQQRVSAVSA